MTVQLPANFTCAPKVVLNTYEQTLYNVLEEYFVLRQAKSNRCPVLSQVRLPDAITISHPVINNIQVNAMSFDCLVTRANATPLCIFEADGHYHKTPVQQQRDALKDAIAKQAGIPVFRVLVSGRFEHPEVVHAQLSIQNFSREWEYPYADGVRQFTAENFPPYQRTIEPLDIEALLIGCGWQFPVGWQYASGYDLRDVASPAPV